MIKKLVYLYKLFLKLVFCLVVGLGAVAYSLIVFPAIYLLPINLGAKQRYSKLVIHYSFKFALIVAKLLRGVRIEVTDSSFLKQNSKIIIANHPSFLDVVILFSLVKRADCIIKKSLFYNPLTAIPINATGYIKNDVLSILEKCNKSLQNGNSLIIFPEGSRTNENQGKLKFLRGAANIALFCKCDFLPVVIRCEPLFLSKNSKWYDYPDSIPCYNLKVMDSFRVDKYVKQYGDKMTSRELTKDIEQMFNSEILKASG